MLGVAAFRSLDPSNSQVTPIGVEPWSRSNTAIFLSTGCGFFEEVEFAWQPRRDWIWPGPGKSAKVLVSWMAQMAGSQWGQAIPTKLSGAQFEQFVLPHLSRGTRGPASKLSPHAIFYYILT